jgi:tetratricopeptide (TPR) repeat protein
MLATTNSGCRRAAFAVPLALLCVIGGPQPAAAAPEAPPERYHRLYEEQKKRWEHATNDAEISWQFARACFDWADLATNDTQRASIAQQGIAAARQGVALDPKSAPAYYYLGMNLGLFAQTRLLGALKLLDEMESSWKRSIALDATFDYAGAHRSLGILYRDAPGWPASLGDRNHAKEHLKKAVELCPAYPDNQLLLLESYLKWGDKKAAATLLGTVADTLEKARQQLTGDAWILAWKDWDRRWESVKTKLGFRTVGGPPKDTGN